MANYILSGHTPILEEDVIKWAQWYKKANRVVKKTDLPGGVRVSTVFLGIDHNFMGGTPLLFETMIFGGENNEFQERYSTWEEAEEGHQQAIELVFQV